MVFNVVIRLEIPNNSLINITEKSVNTRYTRENDKIYH